MSDRLKRILIVGGFILVVVAIAFGIWQFFFKPVFVPPTPPPPTILPPPTVGLPPAPPAPPRVPLAPPAPAPAPAPTPTAVGGVTQTTNLARAATLGASLGSDGVTLQYYNRSDGKFYRVKADGTLEVLSDKVFFNVSNVTWAPDANQAVLEYPDGSNILYNFVTRRQATLPRHWQQFEFSPRSDQIAFLSVGIDEDSRWLAVAAPDGSGSRPIEPLGTNASKVQVAWSPNDQIIAFARTGSPQSFGTQEIILVGKNKENFRSLIVNGIGFAGRWSPDGAQIVYHVSSADSDWKPELWMASGTPGTIGANKTPLGVNTWVEKCAFSGSTTLYCAVPQTLERGVGLYPQSAGNTADELWRMELTSGVRQRIAIPEESHTIGSLTVSLDERYLYFTDKISGQVYRINLK